MATNHTFFNPGPVSLVYTSDGLSVDAQDRVTGNPRNPILARLVKSGQLVDLGASSNQPDPGEPDQEDEPDGVVSE